MCKTKYKLSQVLMCYTIIMNYGVVNRNYKLLFYYITIFKNISFTHLPSLKILNFISLSRILFELFLSIKNQILEK